ncbi:WH2 domain-containing protein [Balamuthia mandrillaris]
MASQLKSKFEQEAAAQKAAAERTTKQEPTGVQALLKQHKNFIDPPPPKVSWKAHSEGQTAAVEQAHVRYKKEGGKPTGPPPKKSLSDLP